MSKLLEVLFLSFIVAITYARKNGGGYKEAIKSCDAYVDLLIEKVMLEHGDYFDPHPINETILSFKKKIVFVDFKGEAKLSEGLIIGLRDIHRVSSCSLTLENGRLKLSSKLQTDYTFFNFTGSVKVMKMGPAVFVHGNSSTVEINMSFTVNSTSGKESLLEEFSVENFNNVIVLIEGLRLLNWMEEPLRNSAANFFKASVKKLVEVEMKEILREQMLENSFSLAEFEIDLDDITDTKITTVDDIIEGKLVYTKFDSNSYIDSILENRYMLEGHYSKLDPYTLEDVRINNVFSSSLQKQDYIELSNGYLEDLLKIKRIQDCSQPVLRNSNITFTCYLGFDKLQINYMAKAVKTTNSYDFEMISIVLNTRISVKITTNVKDNIPNLIDFNVNNLGKFTVKVAHVIADAEGPIYFSDTRFNQKVLIDHFSQILRPILVGRFKDVLSYSIYKTPVHFLDYVE